jgi:hypothetical protein
MVMPRRSFDSLHGVNQMIPAGLYGFNPLPSMFWDFSTGRDESSINADDGQKWSN